MPQQMPCSCHASLLSAAAASLAAFCTHSRLDTEDTEVATRTHLISSTLSAWLAPHLEATWRLGSMTCALLWTQSGSECGHSEVNINYLHPHTHTYTHVYISYMYCGKFNGFKWRFQFLCAGIEFQLHFRLAIAAATPIKWVQATHNV